MVGMIKPDHYGTIIRFTCYFIISYFTFHLTVGAIPYAMNFRFLARDVVAKAITGVALALRARCGGGDLSWAIITFSLSSGGPEDGLKE
ncbi:hypothetical protein ACS0TY_023762 [Phlomoides rotata]